MMWCLCGAARLIVLLLLWWWCTEMEAVRRAELCTDKEFNTLVALHRDLNLHTEGWLELSIRFLKVHIDCYVVSVFLSVNEATVVACCCVPLKPWQTVPPKSYTPSQICTPSVSLALATVCECVRSSDHGWFPHRTGVGCSTYGGDGVCL